MNAVTNINGAIDAVHAGTLDGAHHVPAYYYGKDHAVSLMGTGPMMGMSGQMWLAWYYYGGGQALYEKLVQTKLKLNVVSLFHMPMQNQPLGWFKNEIKGPDDFKGMKFRTVGLATGIYQGLGASVVSVAGAEVASSLDRSVIDAAEFNNTTSDTVYGLPDVRKVLMARSYHQPSEILEISLNKTEVRRDAGRPQGDHEVRRLGGVGERRMEVHGQELQGLRRTCRQGREGLQDPAVGARRAAQGLGHGHRGRIQEQPGIRRDPRLAEGLGTARLQVGRRHQHPDAGPRLVQSVLQV